MRTRKRLIEVLETCNWEYIQGALPMRLLGEILNSPTDDYPPEFSVGLARAMANHQSPHYRDLAVEVLHYLTEDAR